MSKEFWSKHVRPDGAWITFDEIGDKAVGTVLRLREHTFDIDKGPTPIIDLDTGEEQARSLSCAPMNLRAQLADLGPDVGDKIGVKFVGTEKLPGRPQPLKKFDVRILEKAAPPVIEAPEEFSEEPF